jgi:uncharacterized membrane-anchored protein YitT (DUF2179 family)
LASANEKANVTMQIIVSLAILAFGALVLTSPNRVFPTALDAGVKQMAAAWVGAVVGYWLS